MKKEDIKLRFDDHLETIKQTFNKHADKILEISKLVANTYKKGNRVLIAGNGGSAADSQHMATELVNRLYHHKKALSAIALSTDTSILTAWSNDEGFDYVYERQVEAHGHKGDILVVITTSGNSMNLIHAVKKAKEMGLITIALLGKDGGKMKRLCDYEIIVPSNDVARIQEAHELIYHLVCEYVEKQFVEQ